MGNLHYTTEYEIDMLTVALHEEWAFQDIVKLRNYIVWFYVME